MMPYLRVLVGFARMDAEVQGYVDLEITFGDKGAKILMIRYMVVNAPSTYNILLGWPLVNKLGEIISMTHRKMKFLLDDGSIGIIRIERSPTSAIMNALEQREDFMDQQSNMGSILCHKLALNPSARK